MAHRSVVPVLAWLCASAALAAADFWKDKESTAWSASEAEQMLVDSPWSRKVVIVDPDLSLASRVGGLSGGVVGRGVGSRPGFGGTGGGVGGDGAGNLGGGSFLGSPERINVAVRWSSALPVKLARARLQSLGKFETDVPVNPAADEPYYRVSIAGLPPRAFASPTELTAETLLKRPDGSSLEPINIHSEYEGELLTIEFRFARADPITAAHREVEFVTQLGSNTIKRKFRLADMMFRGNLEL
jgi:hypothetical protein